MPRDVASERTTFVPLFPLSSLQESPIVFGGEESSLARTPRRFIQAGKFGRGLFENQPKWHGSRSHSRWPGALL